MKLPSLFLSFGLITVLLFSPALKSFCYGQDLLRRVPFFVSLPEVNKTSAISLEESIANRRSIRSYSNAPVSLNELSQILWAAYGITKPNTLYKTLRGGYRTVPSAGALYPLEIYICAGNISGLEDGIYWYRPDGNKLIRVVAGDQRETLCAATVGQRHFKNAAALIVISADFKRTESKYGNRGVERYVCMEAGHSSQNIYLQCTALKIGTCAVGAFNDNKVKRLMGMKDEKPLYIMPIGKLISTKDK